MCKPLIQEEKVKRQRDLEEWRKLRAEQGRAYQESLKADRDKVCMHECRFFSK